MHAAILLALAFVGLVTLAFGEKTAARLAAVAAVVIGSAFAVVCMFVGYVLYRVVMGTI